MPPLRSLSASVSRTTPALALLTALAAVAPDALSSPNNDLSEISLEDLMQVPVSFVSGVSKYEQSIRSAPAGVTVFTAADIRDHGWRTLSDALRSAPGIHIRSDRFYDYVGARGFTRPFDYNTRVLVLVDGHRINDAVYQQGSVGTEFILDLDMVERIEIIRGPGSSLYGSNAFYGAINVIPKKGRDLAGGQAALTVGSEPSAKGRLSVGDRTASGVEYTFSATGASSRGEDDFALPDDWRGADPSFTATRARDRDDLAVGNLYAHASWRALEAEAAYVRRKKDVLPSVYFTGTDTPAFGIDERAYALLRATTEPSPDSTFNAKLALDHYHYEGRFSPAVTNLEPQLPYADALSANLELLWRQSLADRHTLLAGLEYQENFRQDLGRDNLATGDRTVLVRESSRYLSPFAQLDWHLAEQLLLSAGARYDHYSTDEQRATPRLGLIWDASASTTLKLLYGESFRVPNIEERYTAEAGLVPNPDLDPETSRTWELSAEHRLDSVWTFDARLFHVVSNDLITTVPTNANPLDPGEARYDNVDDYVSRGLDLGASAYFTSGFRIGASATFQRAEDDATGHLVADAPRVLFKLLASAPLHPRWLRLSAELQHVGDRRDADGVSTDPYTTANLVLRAAPVWDRWDFSLSVFNVADARWAEPKNSGRITSPPRAFVLRATCDF